MSYTSQTWNDNDPATPVSAARLAYIESGLATVANGGSLPFNVVDYGALGNGSHDDTTAFQAAFTAAIAVGGTVKIPKPSSYYILSDTITCQPASGTQMYLNIDAEGPFNAIRWNGSSNKSMFKMLGWKHSWVRGVKVNLDLNSATNVIVWDCDVTVTYPSTSSITFYDCFVGLWASTNSVAWRMGHTSGGLADVSSYVWNNCQAFGSSDGGSTIVTGQTGWLNESQNGLNWQWFGCYATCLDYMYSNHLTSGAGSSTGHGNDAMYFYGMGATANQHDFYLEAPGSYTVTGGRFENGHNFIYMSAIVSFQINVTCTGVELSSYGANDGTSQIVTFLSPGNLIFDGCYFKHSLADYTSAFILLNATGGSSSARGTMFVRGGGIRASDPFWNVPGGTFDVSIQNVGKLNSSGNSTALFTHRVPIANNNSTNASPIVTAGTGSPEGSITAVVASVYYRLDGAAGTTVYVKESGTGNTGWVEYGGRSMEEILRAGLSVVSWNYQPETASNNSAPTSQTIYAMAIPLRAGQVVAKVGFVVAVAGAGTTPTNIFVGLADSTGKMVAQSADVKADTGWTSTGIKTFSLSGSYTVPTTGIYYVVFLENGTWGTTQMALGRTNSNGTQIDGAGTYIYATGGTAQTVLPANNSSITLSGAAGPLDIAVIAK